MSESDLTTVEENATVQEQLDAELVAPEPAIAEDLDQAATAEYADHARRISQHSGMSGTTAKTSFSQEEIGELDRDNMVDVLPNLSTASDDLAKLLVPADLKLRPVVRKEIRTAGTKHNKLYNNRVASMNVHKHTFGSTEYIQPSIVLRALFGVQNMKDVPQGPWRPDNVIFKINLSQMLRSLLVVLPGNNGEDVSADGYNGIEMLDTNFASAIAGPEFRQSAFQLCLSILTQLSIIRLTVYMADPNFLPSQTITRTFYAPDDDGDLVFRHRNVLHMSDPSREEQAIISNLLLELSDQLVGMFDDNDRDTWMPALGSLRAQYPWEQFVDHVIQYHLERKQELDEQIAAVGGIDQIMAGLSEEVERVAEAKKAEQLRESFSRPGSTPKKTFGKGGARALKARQRQLEASAAPAPGSAPVAQMTDPEVAQTEQQVAPVDDEWQRVEDDDEQALPPAQSAAQSTARSTLAALSDFQEAQRQNATKGKGRSFIDRQEGAQRVAFDDSQLTQYAVPTAFQYHSSSTAPYYQTSPRRNAAKRTYAAVDEELEDFEPTQDQGFEVDNRDLAAADQRRQEVAQRAPQPRFSSMASSVPGPTSGIPAGTAPTGSGHPSPSKRQRKNPGSTIPDPPAPYDPDEYVEIPPEERMQRAKIAARHGTVRASQMKAPQVRQPWTPEEENALIEIIEEECDEGISYAKLKVLDSTRGAGARLGNRNAEDLRFKARNMKETFLK